VVQSVDGLDLTTNVVLARSSEEVLDSRVSLVNATKDFSSLELPAYIVVSLSPRSLAGWLSVAEPKYLLVGLVDIVNGQNGQVTVIAVVDQGNALTGAQLQVVDGLLRDIEGDGHGE
jgi:hypothetical protein